MPEELNYDPDVSMLKEEIKGLQEAFIETHKSHDAVKAINKCVCLQSPPCPCTSLCMRCICPGEPALINRPRPLSKNSSKLRLCCG